MNRYLRLTALAWVFFLLAVALVVGACSGARGQWVAGGCGPVGPNVSLPLFQPAFQPRQVEYPRFVWKAVPGDDSQAALFEYGRQLGNYSFETGKFRKVTAGDVWSAAAMPAGVVAPKPAAEWIVRQKSSHAKERACAASCGCSQCGETCECGKSRPPCSSACRCLVANDAGDVLARERRNVPPTGVCPDKVQHGKTTLCGKDITAKQAIAALEGGQLADDSGLNHLTVIGTPAECQPVLADLTGNAALMPLKGRLVVQDYRPEQGRVRDAGFKCDGHPSIYLQAPNGKVLHRQDGYRGADKLAEAIRKADPNYDPSKDPDLNKQPAPKPQPRTPDNPASQVPWYFWAGLAGLAVLILKK